jgi:DNA-binding IclR family transcriptional regulator
MRATVLPKRQRTPRRLESVHRAAQALSLFLESDAEHGLHVTEAARRLRVNKSTVSRLFATLRDLGFVTADADRGCYYVGPTAYAVGCRFSGAALARAVQHVIRDLSAQASSTAQFGMLQGNRVVFLTVNPGPHRLRVVARPGDVQYVHASAMGKSILAALPVDVRDRLISTMLDHAALLPAVGPRTYRDPAGLRTDVMRTAKLGYSVSNEEGAAGMVGIGAYVGSAAGIHTALSVAFPIHQHKGAARISVAGAVVRAAMAARRLLIPNGIIPAAATEGPDDPEWSGRANAHTRRTLSVHR